MKDTQLMIFLLLILCMFWTINQQYTFGFQFLIGIRVTTRANKAGCCAGEIRKYHLHYGVNCDHSEPYCNPKNQAAM